MGISSPCQQLKDYSVHSLLDAEGMSEEKGQRKAKGRIKTCISSRGWRISGWMGPRVVLFGILVKSRVSFFCRTPFSSDSIYLYRSIIDQVITTSLGEFGSKPRQNRFNKLSSLKGLAKKKSDVGRTSQKFDLMLNLFHEKRSAA